MIESGRRRILFLTDSSSYSANKKLEGYERALKDHGLPVLGDLKIYAENRIHFVRDILLARRTPEYDGVFDSDAPRYGGYGNIDESVHHFTQPDPLYAPHGLGWLKLYLPARSAQILKVARKRRGRCKKSE